MGRAGEIVDLKIREKGAIIEADFLYDTLYRYSSGPDYYPGLHTKFYRNKEMLGECYAKFRVGCMDTRKQKTIDPVNGFDEATKVRVWVDHFSVDVIEELQ